MVYQLALASHVQIRLQPTAPKFARK